MKKEKIRRLLGLIILAIYSGLLFIYSTLRDIILLIILIIAVAISLGICWVIMKFEEHKTPSNFFYCIT
jgi:hypothetical protein